ncbi:pseudouridine synthase [Actinacidiphila acididurans]|uniref:Pseudouridine synthase n=1 Tax=Actinacidiphila acididurans TaxID=2784346 RepID=A0ABS2TUV7_9ACTN|nr:pseudouridine synthase [Actinacidiphila acididurans]MBM9506075.1 rRNA pseudouridine synthase [Actinacidiphila acididurans]
MRSSDRNSGGDRTPRGSGGDRRGGGTPGGRRSGGGSPERRGGAPDRSGSGQDRRSGTPDRRGSAPERRGSAPERREGAPDGPARPRRPRPEERRYDVGSTGQSGANRPGGMPRTKGTTPKATGNRGKGTVPAVPRELEAQIEERNRQRHDKARPALPKTFPGAEQEGERLQKVLARAGMGSRRACEELIEQRRVEVNGRIVTEQGLRVDPAHDEVKVDGLTVATQSYLFFALNKPAGVVSTMEDPDGRQCLGDYVTNRETRLFHVGRLDTETEGIILLTNHGELAHRLTHPRYGVKKTYLAAIQGPLPRDLGKQLKNGIELEDGWARADHFRVVQNTGKNYLVEVTLHEGRKHIVRRMLAEAGFPVDKLVRTGFGPIPLGDQKSGWLRRLTNTEVGMLMREVDL